LLNRSTVLSSTTMTTRKTSRAARRPAGAPSRRADPRDVERLARNFRALGDPTRSRMVLALCGGERCVSELAHLVGLSLSATSHQLRILRDLDLVRVRRAGKQQFYALNEPAFGFCSPRSCQAWRSLAAPGGSTRS
jgi:DNA-binding transcriptional ArsR family regulator